MCEHVPGFSQVMKCHSTDCVHYTVKYLLLTETSSEPPFFPLHTPDSGHNCVLLQRKVELKLQGKIFTHLGMHKEYKHKMWNGNSSVGRANHHVVWKQLSGNEGQNMEGFCGSGTCLKHV